MRHTKIIATVGPASDTEAALDALIAAGTDIFRLNFSHVRHESQAATHAVRAASAGAGCEVAILQDPGGRRSAPAASPGARRSSSRPGDGHHHHRRRRRRTRAAVHHVRRSREGRAPQLIGCCWPDGRVELRVRHHRREGDRRPSSKGRDRRAQRDQRAGRAAADPAVTPKDVDDLKFGLSLGVDMVALSFVQTAADVQQAR